MLRWQLTAPIALGAILAPPHAQGQSCAGDIYVESWQGKNIQVS